MPRAATTRMASLGEKADVSRTIAVQRNILVRTMKTADLTGTHSELREKITKVAQYGSVFLPHVPSRIGLGF